jgi:hypothetical protein
MDFNVPEELQMLKGTVRGFVDTELIPLERQSNSVPEVGGIDYINRMTFKWP